MIWEKVDCIAANGVASIRAAKQASGSIPIVMVNVDADPVELGFVASLSPAGRERHGMHRHRA